MSERIPKQILSMTTYQLITLDPLARVTDAIGGYPPKRSVGDPAAWGTPSANHRYVPIITARPAHDPDTQIVVRALTATEDGWAVQAKPEPLPPDADAIFRSTIAAGYAVEPEGYSLAMDDTDRANWSQLLVLLREAEDMGGMTGDSPVSFLDLTGAPRQATLTRFRQIMVGLGGAYQTAFFARHSGQ
jgi:hypothetical protein